MREVSSPAVFKYRKTGQGTRQPAERLQEALRLTRALNLQIAGDMTVPLIHPNPATLFGSGKVAMLERMIADRQVGLVIIDHPISAVQQRNLERAWKAKVLDRTGLILEIFGDRAQSREGRLQVELAHLSYQKSRLVRSWTHLDRQRGGFGFLGGPGETQIEADRRLISERIKAIRTELETVVRTRALHRQSRRRAAFPHLAIVGYTNAGKSTLFNRLTGAGVLAEDMLFATLDPAIRQIRFPSGAKAAISDTVGFISDLPTSLIAAFRATLEEVVEADAILHIRDMSSPQTAAERADVYAVLQDLGIGPGLSDKPIIEVWNKIDRLAEPDRTALAKLAARSEYTPQLISAETGEGIPSLLAAIEAEISRSYVRRELSIAAQDGALVNWLYENASIESRSTRDDGEVQICCWLSPAKSGQLDSMLRRH